MTDNTESHAIDRRRFLRLALFGSLGLAGGGAVAGFVAFAYPRSPFRYGDWFTVDAARVPAVGEAPRLSHDGGFWLVNLARGEGREPGDDRPAPGGLLALSWACPHEHCTIPWRPDFAWQDDDGPRRLGWFACPCCGAVFTKAGVRVFGPAPRSMDRYPLKLSASGDVAVDTSRRSLGAPDNARYAIPLATLSVVRAGSRTHTGGNNAIQP